MESASHSALNEAAIAFLQSRVNFERQSSTPYGEAFYKLDRMRRLLERLGDPQHGMKIVHVAGTKGKGSTSTMIARVLQAASLRTGLYTSPHLDGVEQRFAVDGAVCSRAELVELIELIRPAVDAMDRQSLPAADGSSNSPTYFEITTALALLHFARSKVDAAVLEVGMGGRLDSTNVCQPILCVITNIGLDHVEHLGDTLAAIAREKAGILKPGVPAVSGVMEVEPRDEIRRIAAERGCRLVEAGVDFHFDYRLPAATGDQPRVDVRFSPLASPLGLSTGDPRDVVDAPLGMLGRHQAANAGVAVAAIRQLQSLEWNISDEAIRRGLSEATLPARIEVVARRPTVVVDAAHTVDSIAALLSVLDESFSADRRILVLAATKNKDFAGMLRLAAPRFDHLILTRYENNARGAAIEDLEKVVASLGCRSYEVCPSPVDACRKALTLAGPDSLVCITGSFFIAAETRGLFPSNVAPDSANAAICSNR